ncbi:MAG: hypothetical protein BM556_12345 [Bacteriovorax sp. MedPE-SWde]|nr:MAG: hypothetical protein BM556_12345 [Bacteriovorax sp. MedPE-SWde]
MTKSKTEFNDLSKAELEKLMHDRNVDHLKKEGGIESLLIFNLENFAYRYLETTDFKNIQCQFEDKDFWVESIETNIVEALKWDNKDVKAKLIELCKQNPGANSKNIKVKLTIGTRIISDEQVDCYACIDWGYPEFNQSEGQSLRTSEELVFDDPIILRNTHATFLEKVCTIF